MLSNKAFILLCAPHFFLTSDQIHSLPSQQCATLRNIFPHFSTLAMVGVLVGGNRDVVPPLLIVHDIALYTPITHVWVESKSIIRVANSTKPFHQHCHYSLQL